MRIAGYNVENLFQRVKVFNGETPTQHQGILEQFAELNRLFERAVYSEADKARMLELMAALGILNRDEGPFVWLRKIRGRLIVRPRAGAPRIEAVGRDAWVGWCELKTGPVDEVAIQNTARVIADAHPDVLALVEVESRPVMLDFHRYIYGALSRDGFAGQMLIDGNDARGIDVGLMLKPGYRITAMLSHVDEAMPNGEAVFSRDCPEFSVETPSGARLTVLPNHFKSKFGGDTAAGRGKRLAQATAVAGYYRRLIAEGRENVVVLGDLNDLPDSAALAPLFATDLREVSAHPGFTEFEYRAGTGGRGIGTFATGSDANKIDYILLSPALWDKVSQGGIFRKGAWTPSDRWDMYISLSAPQHAASDHHLIWVDIDV